MLKRIKEISQKFLEQTKEKKVIIISHYDTDGITSASIMASVLKKIDRNFSIKIVKQLEQEIIEKLPKNKILVFLDLGSGNIEQINKLKNDIYILDHHEIKKIRVGKNINIINPHLSEEEDLCGACLTYLFAKEIDKDNKDLANLAIIGMVGDMMEKNIGKIGNSIINDAEIIIKKGILFYPATRPLHKALEFSSSMYIPGVTGSSTGAINLLRDAGIYKKDGKYKSLMELNDDEMSRLLTAILLKRNKRETEDLVGYIYLVKFSNRLEDARELSAIINACSRMGNSNIALTLCMGNKESRKKAEKIYAEYKQHLIEGLSLVSNIKKIEGDNYVIINAKNSIKDTIIGTIATIIAVSSVYKKGTAIITMAYNGNKIKVSGRIAGRRINGRNENSKNIREILESVVKETGGEIGGHDVAAGCLISRAKEKEFIAALEKKLNFELIKV